MNKYYFTFGSGQKYEGCYVVIEAENAYDARQEMFQRYGKKWGFMYKSAEEAGVERWGLKEIK